MADCPLLGVFPLAAVTPCSPGLCLTSPAIFSVFSLVLCFELSVVEVLEAQSETFFSLCFSSRLLLFSIFLDNFILTYLAKILNLHV